MAIPYVISREAPNSVIYDLTQPNKATITLPSGSTWSSGLHWHETHTEYLRVLKGTVRVRLGNEVLVLSPADGEIKVARNVWHEWSRARPDGDDVVVAERTDPEDGDKAIFFWNVNAVILNAQNISKPTVVPAWLFGALMDVWVSLNLFVIFAGLDNLPVFLGLGDVLSGWGLSVVEGTIPWHFLAILERGWSHMVVGFATRLGWFLGVRAVRPKFTPPGEYRRWKSRAKGKKTQ